MQSKFYSINLETLSQKEKHALGDAIADDMARGWIGQSCMYCGRVYQTLEDVNAAETMGPNRLPVHTECYQKATKKESQSMTNLPALNNSLTIQTVDGQTIDLTNFNPLDVVTPSSSGKPLYRVAVGQPRDDRFLEASNKLFLTRKLRVDGKTETDNVGPFEGEMTVYPLAVWANRSFMPPYDKNGGDDGNKPLCHSENFITPDAQYMGTYSNQCCAFDSSTNRVVAVCPMAKWGEKSAATGKSTPPQCSESYILFAALTIQTDDGPQAEVVEVYFSRSSATNGKNLTQKLRAMQQQGQAIWEYPIKLTVKPVGQGNTVEGSFVQHIEMEQADAEGMMALSNRAEEAISYRKERASRLPEAQGENAGEEIPFDTVPAQPSQPAQASRPTQPTQPVTKPIAAAPINGAKKKSLI